MPGCNLSQDFPAVCSLLLLLASVALAKGLRPKALDHWNTVSGGSLCEIRDGCWWQLFTPAIVHADARHFLYNALFFFAYGCVLESVVGSWPVVALFFGSHIVGFFLKLLINRIRDPEMYMFIGGLGSSSATYFFAFFLLAACPSRSVSPFGSAFLCLFVTYTLPDFVKYLHDCVASTGNFRVVFHPFAAAATGAVLALLYTSAPLFTPALPNSVSISAYITLHFTIQSLYRASKRAVTFFSGASSWDPTDHTLHFMCATAGVAYACSTRLLPDESWLPLAALWLLLLARVFFHSFPF